MNPVARPARRSDIGALSNVLARAFEDDPVFEWMLPDKDSRVTRSARLFGLLTRHHHFGHGGVEVTEAPDGRIAAATLWDPPGHWKQNRLREALMLPGLIWAFGSRLQAGGAVAETMSKEHPTEPHWYLSTIGSDPEFRGGGYGRALMLSRLDRCDAEHAPAYLESSKPQNISYYERFGFEVTKEIQIAPAGPPVWAMWRNPR